MLSMYHAINLRLVLDNNTTIFELGDTIQGMVIVDVRDPIHCKKLVISNRFKTHGRGNGESQDIASLIVFEGEWQPGRYQYPFSFTLPSQKSVNTPASFYGHYVNVTWQITAMADVKRRLSLAKNPQAEIDYTLVNPAAKIITDTDINDNKINFIPYVLYMLFLSPFLIMGLASLSHPSLTNLFFDLIFAFLFISLVRSLLEKLALKKFGMMRLTVNDSVVNNRLNATLTITPEKDMTVNALSASLIYIESATSGSGSSATTHKHEKVLSSVDLTGNSSITLTNNSPKSFDLSLPLSAPLTATLHLNDNHISYKIEIAAKVGNKKHEWVQDLTII